MAGIRGRDTKPELMLRQGLHRRGFRFRLHAKELPGKPDIVFPKYRAIILAHGCFWHGHDCVLFKWPSTRREFWHAKITGNRVRDMAVQEKLCAAGWRVLTVWECALKGRDRLATETILDRCARWLVSGRRIYEIRGRA